MMGQSGPAPHRKISGTARRARVLEAPIFSRH